MSFYGWIACKLDLYVTCVCYVYIVSDVVYCHACDATNKIVSGVVYFNIHDIINHIVSDISYCQIFDFVD